MWRINKLLNINLGHFWTSLNSLFEVKVYILYQFKFSLVLSIVQPAEASCCSHDWVAWWLWLKLKFTLHYNCIAQELDPVAAQAAGECTFLIILV